MKRKFLSILFFIGCLPVFAQQTVIHYLSGTDKDHTIDWDFYCTGGRNSGKWTKIPVPSNWELQRFGNYNYGHDKIKSDERGIYRYEFLSEKWSGKKVFIVFEGSMTDTKVTINGKIAGAVHQGGFYRFKYDITRLIRPLERNTLEVTVDKTSGDTSVNNAERRNSDFWIFGGIFRPVYLEIVPDTYIDRVAINAKANGSFQLRVYPVNLRPGDRIQAQVQTLHGENLGKPILAMSASKNEYVDLKAVFNAPLLWSAEFPNLYQVDLTIRNKKNVRHRLIKKFGFRTVEIRSHDGLYVNGAKIMLKGSCRHSFWPESGRTLSYSVHLRDVELMKEMNMNAVRMSHYPPDQEFLDICDSLGLYVLDELTGWQAKYDTIIGQKLVKELVIRDVNHPSIIFWDNGNEGGWNRGLDNDFRLYDPQQRTVIHPWEKFNGTDTKHYPDYKYIKHSVDSGTEVFFPTEFMHGLYDGGAGASLDDFWMLMRKHPHGAGGFIWAFLDESVIRTDKNGAYDGDGNHAPDGIVGPHREKEASFFTIKEVWSPVYIDTLGIQGNFNGNVLIENRYSFTNLNQCSFTWKLVHFPSSTDKNTPVTVDATGSPAAIDLMPGKTGMLHFGLPISWKKSEALYLTAYGPDHKEIFTWSWALQSPAYLTRSRYAGIHSKITTTQTDSSLIIQNDGVRYYFGTATGYIQQVVTREHTIPLSRGPVFSGIPTKLKKLSVENKDDEFILRLTYEGQSSFQATWHFVSGQAVRLDYQYDNTGDAEFAGITFEFPESEITGMKWLGRGPYRVWKNRLKGQQFGIWHKSYNNTITGENWAYPEFKGYHAELNWVRIENKNSDFTISTPDPNLYLQILRPAREKDALVNNNVEPSFPDGCIGFLQAIPAIGTKFHSPAVMGPQAEINHLKGKHISGTLWLDFVQ